MNRSVLASPADRLRATFEALVLRFLDRGPVGAALRMTVVGLTLLLYWFTLTLMADPTRVAVPEWISSLPFPLGVLAGVLGSFFAPNVLIHLLPVTAGVWLGFRLGVHYLIDLFEIESPGIAARYLRSALFGLSYDTLHITSGELKQLDWSSPIFRIGGPGYLTVQLGYAAVFETPEGHPRVYGPAQRRFIAGFERLRDVVDLRDQLRTVDEARAVTRDGIEVYARDAQMVFRVFGGGGQRSLEDPYPFTDEAIRRLVYGQAVTEQGLQEWAAALPRLVLREIANFVAGLTIEEFLALQPRDALQSEAAMEPLSGDQTGGFHIPRHQLTERFHTRELHDRLQEAGLELAWVGVGTWEVRDKRQGAGSPGPGETLIAAWQRLQRARLQRSTDYLQRVRQHSAREAMGRVLRGWLDAWESGGLRGGVRCRALLSRIHADLEEMRRELTSHPESELPLDFGLALHHLSSLGKPTELGEAGL